VAEFQFEVFWVVTPCSVVVGHQRLRPWRWRQQDSPKWWYTTKQHTASQFRRPGFKL